MKGIFDSSSTNVLECKNCGLQFLDKIMTEKEENDYYNSYYRNQSIRHFKKMDFDDIQLQSYKHYKQYDYIYKDLIEKFDKIFEIGSGSGGFLRFVKEHFPNKKLISLERCPENSKYIKNYFGEKVRLINDLKELGKEKFDCIVAFGVFEHVRDSRFFLTNLRKSLSDKGVIALNIPNKFHSLTYNYKLAEFKKFSYMKQHYYTFTEKSHHILAEQTGFNIKKFNYMQFWGLDNQLSWLRYRKPRKFDDITGILSSKTLKSYAEDMIRNKTTDLYMVVYEKNYMI